MMSLSTAIPILLYPETPGGNENVERLQAALSFYKPTVMSGV
jgi:hypothetical protein